MFLNYLLFLFFIAVPYEISVFPFQFRMKKHFKMS